MKRYEAAHIRKDALLGAIAQCAWILLQENEVSKAIGVLLNVIGPVSGQDRRGY